MNPLNFHNFFVLAELYNYQNKVLVMLDKNPVACISNNLIRTTADNDYNDVDPLLHHILCNESKATLSAHTNITCNRCTVETRQSLPETLLRYINALPDSFFARMETTYFTIIMKSRPTSLEYKYFSYLSNDLVPPDLYEWLNEYFELMQEMSFSDLYSLYALDKKGSREDLLRSLLMLNSMGLITCLYNDTLSLIEENKKEIPLANKLLLAIYISLQLNKHNHIITIKCDNMPYILNLFEPTDDNLVNVSIPELFFSVLSGSSYIGETFFINTSEIANFNAIRLNLFQHLKRLPAELFEENFNDEKSEYLLILRDNDYAKHLSNYIKAGMDMTDLSVLSLIKSAKISVDEITNILPYPTDEINKSIFSLLVLGLITVEMSITSDE